MKSQVLFKESEVKPHRLANNYADALCETVKESGQVWCRQYSSLSEDGHATGIQPCFVCHQQAVTCHVSVFRLKVLIATHNYDPQTTSSTPPPPAAAAVIPATPWRTQRQLLTPSARKEILCTMPLISAVIVSLPCRPPRPAEIRATCCSCVPWCCRLQDHR